MGEKETHFIGKITQKALIEHNGKILVCRGIGDNLWQFPGGRLDANESPIEGLIREIKEELSLDVSDVVPLCVESSFHIKDNASQVLIAYTCSIDNPTLHTNEEESEEVKWVSKEELAKLPMFDDCAKVIKQFYSNSGI